MLGALFYLRQGGNGLDSRVAILVAISQSEERRNTMLSHEDMTLTVEETATLLCVSPDTIHRLIREGWFPSEKEGRHIVVPKDKLADYLHSLDMDIYIN
jgi:excisionase family DNA binding protein